MCVWNVRIFCEILCKCGCLLSLLFFLLNEQISHVIIFSLCKQFLFLLQRNWMIWNKTTENRKSRLQLYIRRKLHANGYEFCLRRKDQHQLLCYSVNQHQCKLIEEYADACWGECEHKNKSWRKKKMKQTKNEGEIKTKQKIKHKKYCNIPTRITNNLKLLHHNLFCAYGQMHLCSILFVYIFFMFRFFCVFYSSFGQS